MTEIVPDFYCIGGTLDKNARSYVPRQADTDLYVALKKGKFCYVLNSSQMGKSSLIGRVAERLRQDGAKVVLPDISGIGSQEITIEQWYNGLLHQIGRPFGLNKAIREFLAPQNLEPVQRWMEAIRYVVFTLGEQPLIICFDEIDVVRNLPFCVDDFFAAIRSFYNARSQETALQRLTFCLSGAAKPTDLIEKSGSTPFDIGHAIELTGFQFKEAKKLAEGLKTRTTDPDVALRVVLDWTNGQPFLTQKVCHLVQQLDAPIPAGQEADFIKQLVQDKIINYWESQDNPEHLGTIRNRLLERENKQYIRHLLALCQQVNGWSTSRYPISSDDEIALRLTGLMVKSQGQLRYFNKIYEKVFDQEWIRSQLKKVIGDNPYLGLSAFGVENAAQFFGREQLTAMLWEKCCDLRATQAPHFLAILGPSGSGKSSVARAGLMVALEKRLLPGLQHLQFDTITPTEHPIEKLAGVLATKVEGSFDENQMIKLLKNQEDALISLVASLSHIDAAPWVILIDQFEEIYTSCKKAVDRKAFIDNLMTAVSDKSGRLFIILTLRSDFLGETQAHEALNQLISKQHVIVPMMTQTELHRAIAQPAENAGHSLDTATIALLLEQTKDKEGILPLLQFALKELWMGLMKGVEPADTLENIGGVGGALAQKAEKIYQGLSDGDKKIADRAFLKLVEPGTKNTRRRANMDEIVAHHEDDKKIHSLLNKFADKEARLITLSENEQGQTTVEITHEALLEKWETLKEWVLTHNEDIRFGIRLSEAARHWESEDRADGLLWSSPDFEQLQKFHKRASQDMTIAQMDFYRASEDKKRWSRWKEWGTVVLVLFLCISVVSTYLAYSQSQKAEQERQNALRTQSLFLADLARQETKKGNATNGILLALEALPKDMSNPERPFVNEAEKTLKEAVSQHRERFVLQGNEPMTYAAFSPDGKQLVTTGSKGSLYFWDVSNGKLLRFLYKAHTARISQVTFSPNGKFLVTASDDRTACLWNKNGKRLFFLKHWGPVSHTTFSPNSRLVLTVFDNIARLWHTSNGKILSTLKHEDRISHAAFSPDGKLVVTTSFDKTARLWDSSNGKSLSVLQHEKKVDNAVFSPDSKQVLTVSTVSTVSNEDDIRLWEISSNKVIKIYHRWYTHDTKLVAFSHDGKRIITISGFSGMVLWNASNGEWFGRYKWEEPLKGYNIISTINNGIVFNIIEKLVFVKYNIVYLKILYDKNLKIFYNKKLRIYGYKDNISQVAFSPNGKLLVTVSKDNTVRLWDASSKVSHTNNLGDIFSSQELIDYANEIVPRCLVPEERKEFFLLENQNHALIIEGEKLARKGQIDKAIEKFEQAKTLEYCHKFEPKERAEEIAAYTHIEKGEKLVEQDKIEAAIFEFQKAQKLDFLFNTNYMVEDLSNRIKMFKAEEEITLLTPSKSTTRRIKYGKQDEHDKRGNLIYTAYFDETGNPTTHSQYGFHKFTQKFDEQNNFMEFAVFDVVGNPTTYKDGYHKYTKKIKEGGSQMEWLYLDVMDNPTIPNHVSYHKLVIKFDAPGVDTEWAYFDIDGQLIRKYDGEAP